MPISEVQAYWLAATPILLMMIGAHVIEATWHHSALGKVLGSLAVITGMVTARFLISTMTTSPTEFQIAWVQAYGMTTMAFCNLILGTYCLMRGVINFRSKITPIVSLLLCSGLLLYGGAQLL